MLVREWKQKTIKHDKYTVYQWHMHKWTKLVKREDNIFH